MSLSGDEPNMAVIRQVVEKMSFSGFPAHIEVRVGRGVVLQVRMNTTDRDTGVPTFIEGQYLIPSWFQGAHQMEAICDWVTEKVMDLIRHELLECVTLDGTRIFDPHKPKAKPSVMLPADVLADLMPNMRRG